MTDISRRSLLGTAAALGLGPVASAAMAGVSAPQKWDRTVNFLIIGTGFAGLAAALEAHEQGMKSVLVVDKMPTYGGNSIINGGAIAAAGTDMQKKAGIKDNADLLYSDIMKAGGGLAHPQLARHIADESVANYEWLRDKIGVKFKAVTYHGGHSVPRSHAVVENTGAGFINPMYKKCQEYGIPVELRTIVDDFVVGKNGEVLGVKVRTRYRFGKEDSGRVQYIRAVNGVLIASGGFAQNVRMRTDHDPRLTAAFTSTNHPGATGEVIQSAQMIGANTIQMDWIQLGPWTSPDEKGFGVCPKFVESSVGYGLMVDPKTGRRFVNETGNRKVRSDAIIATGHPAVILVSEENADHVPPSTIKAGMENGSIRRFANLDELAKFYGIQAESLKTSVNRWNDAIRAKKDPDFNAKIFRDTKENKGVFYACRLWPRVHYCMGGLAINPKAEVINTDLNVIPGLYAAGEVAGGVHGMVRLGTVSIADCVVFGRVAGRNAAQRKI